MAAAYGAMPSYSQSNFVLPNGETAHPQNASALTYSGHTSTAHHAHPQQVCSDKCQQSADEQATSNQYAHTVNQNAGFSVPGGLGMSTIYPTPTSSIGSSAFPFSNFQVPPNHDNLSYGSPLSPQVPLTPASNSGNDSNRQVFNVSAQPNFQCYDQTFPSMSDCTYNNFGDPYGIRLSNQGALAVLPQVDYSSAGRLRVTTTLWEDEGTLCFQVDARGVCVARRQDNNMINGTKLLNVVHMSRGKRDGILKNEKQRVVVKVGAMHLKGVWISFKRAKDLADLHGVTDLLYPIFEPDVHQFLYHPESCARTAAIANTGPRRQDYRDRPLPATSGMSERDMMMPYHISSIPTSFLTQPDRGPLRTPISNSAYSPLGSAEMTARNASCFMQPSSSTHQQMHGRGTAEANTNQGKGNSNSNGASSQNRDRSTMQGLKKEESDHY